MLFRCRGIETLQALPVALLFGIEIDSCARCGGTLRIIARIEEPAVMARILAHLERTAPEQYPAALPLGARAPPARSRLR